MVGFNTGVAGALVGLAIGVSLSVYVALLDMRKRTAQVRVRAHYRGSLVLVPAIFAGLGALAAMGVARVV